LSPLTWQPFVNQNGFLIGESYILFLQLKRFGRKEAFHVMDEASDEIIEDKKDRAKELKQQLEAEKKRSEEYCMRLRYLQADFENLRKRCDREIQQVSQYSNERLLIQLLEVVLIL